MAFNPSKMKIGFPLVVVTLILFIIIPTGLFADVVNDEPSTLDKAAPFIGIALGCATAIGIFALLRMRKGKGK